MNSLRLTLIFCIVLSLFVASQVSVTQAGGDDEKKPTVQDAIAQWQLQNLDGAVELLQQIVADDPSHAIAWVLLGRLHQSKGELDMALDAFLKASGFPQTRGRAMYSLGVLHAQRDDVEKAFEWLFLAKDSANVDVTAIGTSNNIEKLKADPRYAALFPTKEQYADPFVEPVHIVHEWRGEASGDQFGWIARNIGDVDGDGVHDVTTSAPTNAEGGPAAGKVYVYSGKTAELRWTARGNEGAQLGLGIEAAGDVNGDGVPDVLAGAPGEDKAYVYSGGDGALLLSLVGKKGDFFGRKVSDIGDWNDDGHDDVLIGAPSNSENGENAGAAYVFSGRDGSQLFEWLGEDGGDRLGSSAAGFKRDEQSFIVIGAPGAGSRDSGRTYVYKDLSQSPFFVIESDSTGASLGGMFVSVAGDVDADGVPDIYASDWQNAALGRSTGRVYVHSGADGSNLYTMTGEAAGDGFGIGVADAGDVNADGHADLIIGAWQHASAAPSGGKCYLFSGRDGSLINSYTGKVPGETFGFDTTGMGDVNGDGTIDFLLTSAWSAINGSHSGRMFIVSGPSH